MWSSKLPGHGAIKLQFLKSPNTAATFNNCLKQHTFTSLKSEEWKLKVQTKVKVKVWSKGQNIHADARWGLSPRVIQSKFYPSFRFQRDFAVHSSLQFAFEWNSKKIGCGQEIGNRKMMRLRANIGIMKMVSLYEDISTPHQTRMQIFSPKTG